VPFRVVVPVLLMAVLAVLAALQYRWLGQVSLAERARMHETMTRRVEALANDIDREISRLYVIFQMREHDATRFEQAIADRYKLWREAARHNADLITALYTVNGATAELQKFDSTTGTLTPVEWPAHLKTIHDRTMNSRTTRVQTAAGGGGGTASSAFTFRLPPMISTDPLAVSVVVPFISYARHNGVLEGRVNPAPSSLLIELNQKKFVGEMLPQLVTQHLGDSLDEYRVSIVKTRTPADVVYASTTDRVLTDPEAADVRVNTLGVRPVINERLLATELRAVQAVLRGPSSGQVVSGVAAGGARGATPPPPPPAPANMPQDRIAVVFDQPRVMLPAQAGPTATAPQPPQAAVVPRVGTMATATAGSGAWQVLLKHRAGSLEAAVQKVRRRNLLMSFGMLTLLAASVGLVLVSARRAERLASQQMDFVATVSHELRTPLAVIRSAGQNLAAGVVQDPRRYGDLIETEGRRLTDMVEQTLALAGLSGERKPMAQTPIDTGDLVRSVLAAPETAARADGVTFDVRIAEELPLVVADEMLLRRGVQNLVGNALKYGGRGGWIGITVDASGSRRGREVRVTVADRGPGVAAEDLPHIFDAFYRGRRAVADQVQGNGLGLHLVKRIAEAHGGRVTVRTSPGEGAAFTLHIPARGDLAVHSLAGEQPQTS
jgi:signal transduction histidine kinase